MIDRLRTEIYRYRYVRGTPRKDAHALAMLAKELIFRAQDAAAHAAEGDVDERGLLEIRSMLEAWDRAFRASSK